MGPSFRLAPLKPGAALRHFLIAMAAVPEWAPRGEDHLLRSTSVVTRIDYGPARIAWKTFDDAATETLRLAFKPAPVLATGVSIEERDSLGAEGYTARPPRSGGFLVQVRHSGGGEVIVAASDGSPVSK